MWPRLICEDYLVTAYIMNWPVPHFTTGLSVKLRVDLWQAIPVTQSTQAAISIQVLTAMTTVR
jgi:hypothetical protein